VVELTYVGQDVVHVRAVVEHLRGHPVDAAK
jgi:hypothetical protein